MNNEIKYGLYSGIAFSIWVMMEFTTGLHNNHMDVAQYTEMFAMVIPWIFIFSGIRNRKNSLQNGRFSFGEGVRSGLLISLVSSCLIAGFLYVYVNAINTGYSFAKLEFIESKLLDENLTGEKLNQQMEGYKTMYNATFLSHLSLMVMFASIGIVVSAVISFFMRTKTPPISAN